ncbi:nuclear transport factor 2 family protein [Opitutaceae bacterium]|nr:nuclear transport factor 2 family protein [Opitutaceae bacterium]
MRFSPKITFLLTTLFFGSTALKAADLKHAHDTLDQLHLSASQSDGAAYFDLFTDDAVFLGTDASERWPIADFISFATPYFEAGKGWTYVKTERNINVSADGQHASFDELLENKSYGLCRGTGVLRLVKGKWKVEQYHLTIPVPNEIARNVVEQIRGLAP